MTRVPGTRWCSCSDRPRSSTRPVGVDPDPLALHQRPLAVVALVADVHDGVVVELHREVVPHAAQHELALADAVALGLADGPHAPGAVAGPPAVVRRHGEVDPAHREGARPAAGLGQPLGVEDDLALAAHVLARLGHGGDVALPGHVHGHAVLGRLDDDPEAAQRLEDLDAEGPDREVAPVEQGRRGAHDVLRAAVAHVDERVDHAEVRVLAVAEDGEPVTRARVHVEVVAVVEVAVARRGVGDELGRLVDGIVVPGGEAHVGALSSTRSRCRSRPPPVHRTCRPPARPPGRSWRRPGAAAGRRRGRRGSWPARRHRPWAGARRRRRDRSSSGIRRRARAPPARQPTR